MATFIDDMSNHDVDDQADENNATGITGYTCLFNAAGSPTTQNIKVVEDNDAPNGNGKIIRITEDWAGTLGLYVTAIGDHDGDVDARVLWRLDNLTSDVDAHFMIRMPLLRVNTETFGNAVGVGHRKTTVGENPAISFRGEYFQGANDWTHIGNPKDVSSEYVVGDWWWSRMRYVADGDKYSWKVWKYGDPEPEEWDAEDVQNTSLASGYVGFGVHTCTRDPVDVAFFSVGWDGDPSPAMGEEDEASPTVESATVDSTGLKLTVVFSEAVTVGTDGWSGFTLSTGQTPTYDEGDSTDTVDFDLDSPVLASQTPTLAFTQPGDGVQDIAGNLLATFSGQSVTNNSEESGPALELEHTPAEIVIEGQQHTMAFPTKISMDEPIRRRSDGEPIASRNDLEYAFWLKSDWVENIDGTLPAPVHQGSDGATDSEGHLTDLDVTGKIAYGTDVVGCVRVPTAGEDSEDLYDFNEFTVT